MSVENRYSDDGKVHDKERLKELQALPLNRKIQITQTRLIEWYTHWEGKCYVSISGGKDSTVLADLTARACKSLGYKLILWFSDTGLEYPEIKSSVDTVGEYLRNKYEIEVEVVKDYPKDKNGKRITFRKVLEEHGYPLISKEVAKRCAEYRNAEIKGNLENSCAYKEFNGLRTMSDGTGNSLYNKSKYKYLTEAPFKISHKCCLTMKENPAMHFEKANNLKPIVGTMTYESAARKKSWVQNGCNAFNANRPMSTPIAFWTEQDVLEYIKICDLPLASVYGEIKQDENGKYYTTGCNRTGCVFCGFGCHLEKEPNRFQQLKETHPKLYEYCMKPWDEGGLGMDEVLNYINVKH